MGLKVFRYFGICVGVYLLIFVLVLLVFSELFAFFGSSHWNSLLIYNVFLWLIIPLLTRMIAEKIDAKLNDKEEGRQ